MRHAVGSVIKMEDGSEVICTDNGTCKTLKNLTPQPLWLRSYLYYAPMNIAISSSTLEIVPIPKVSTNTLATFGERNAGSVGPK